MSLYARSHDCPTCTCANPLSEPIIDQIVGGEFTSMVNRLGADVREKALIARIKKLETAIRECMHREGFDDTQEAFDWWIEEHQPFEARTVKGKEGFNPYAIHTEANTDD